MTCRTIWKTTFTGLIEESQHTLKEIEKFYVTKVMELPQIWSPQKSTSYQFGLTMTTHVTPPPFAAKIAQTW